MDGRRFWREPGVVAGLEARGLSVLTPDRLPRARTWDAEMAHAASWLSGRSSVAIVAGSNGCTVGARLALTYPTLVSHLLLAWPATPRPADVPQELLSGETLRGLRDVDLASLRLPVGVLRAVPENPAHGWATADALLALIPGAVDLPGCTEPLRPTFAADLDGFVRTVAEFCSAGGE